MSTTVPETQPSPTQPGLALTETTGVSQAVSLLQRVIMPRVGDPLNLRALYVEEDATNRKRSRSVGRTTLELPVDSEISFATYFNAFPASYWRRWSVLDSVTLRLEVAGPCRIDVYRSKADGTQIHEQAETVAGSAPSVLEFSIDLAPFEDGGWIWFDLTTEEEAVSLVSAGWYAPQAPAVRATVAVGICTFNRPDDCVAALAAIGEDPVVLESVGAVIVADQGTKTIDGSPQFSAAQAALGDRLSVHRQGNLGGSGGFSRVMYEALTNTHCEQILLMDDDIVIEPDSILRAAAFAQFAERPTIVGGQMLNLQNRSHLRSMGEVVDRRKFMWRAAPGVEYDHDFAKKSLRRTAWLHRRIDVDYNGWWMCLIPRVVAEEIGLPLPLFIKWDDTEYALRASEAGYPTATVPGVAIWHMPWSDKNDATDWQAYFHLRNRLVVAALHTPYRRGAALVREDMKAVLNHLMSLEYSTVALKTLAIQDFLAGPDALFDALPTALGEIRTKRSEFTDATVLPSSRSLPLPSMDAVKAEQFLKPPVNPVAIGATLATGLVHNVLPPKAQHHRRPQLNIAASDAHWFLLARLDGATVATADGRGVSFRKRNPKTFWTLLSQSVRAHAQLRREFPRMRKTYAQAMPELTSHGSWRRVFGQD